MSSSQNGGEAGAALTAINEVLRVVKQTAADLADFKRDTRLDIAGLKSDMAGVKSDMAGMKSDMAGMKADVQGLKDEARWTRAMWIAHEERIDALERKRHKRRKRS